MIKEGKFGSQEAVCLTIVAISAKVFFSSPATVAALVGTAGWYMTIISALTAAVGFFFIYKLLRRFPGRDITFIYAQSLGPVPGFLFSGILAASLMAIAVIRLAEFNEVIKIYVLPLSPNWFITGIAAVCALVLAILGLESMARFARISIYLLAFGLLAVLILGLQNYDMNNLYPFWGYGLGKTVSTGIQRSSAYGEIILLAVFAESLQGVKFIKREGWLSLLFSGLIISSSILSYTLTFPYYSAMEVAAPMYQLATLIDYGRFFQRLEAIFLFLWVLSTLLSISVIYYASVFVYCRMFGIGDKNPIALAGFAILYALALIPLDIGSVISSGVQMVRSYGAIPAFIMPLIALIAAALRRKGVRGDAP